MEDNIKNLSALKVADNEHGNTQDIQPQRLDEPQDQPEINKVPINKLYRYQPLSYYDYVEEKRDGKMQIDEEVKVLLFRVTAVDENSNDAIFPTSPDGGWGFFMDVDKVLNPENIWYYYCSEPTGSVRKATVFLNERSKEKFESDSGFHLQELDPYKNSFIWCELVGNSRQYFINNSSDFVVEIALTKTVDLFEGILRCMEDKEPRQARMKLVGNDTERVVPKFANLDTKAIKEMLRKRLRKLKLNFVKTTVPIKKLYRNKPWSYFNEAEQNYGRMRPYEKDKAGHNDSEINNNLKALFFGASLYKRGLTSIYPEISPYGGWRFFVDVDKLLDPNKYNWYFADYYCNQSRSSAHNAMVIVFEKESDVEREFCDRLIKLKPYNNSIIWCEDTENGREYFVNNAPNLWVEIAFTESVDLSEGYFKKLYGGNDESLRGFPVGNCPKCDIRKT